VRDLQAVITTLTEWSERRRRGGKRRIFISKMPRTGRKKIGIRKKESGRRERWTMGEQDGNVGWPQLRRIVSLESRGDFQQAGIQQPSS
jgi:hypothetical protein